MPVTHANHKLALHQALGITGADLAVLLLLENRTNVSCQAAVAGWQLSPRDVLLHASAGQSLAARMLRQLSDLGPVMWEPGGGVEPANRLDCIITALEPLLVGADPSEAQQVMIRLQQLAIDLRRPPG